VTAPSRTRKLTREFLYLLAGILVGLLFVPAIGSVYYHEDIGIGYRQFLGGLLDPETALTAVVFVLAPYLLALLVRSVAWAWHRFVLQHETSVSRR
jgi:hypothetical protein